MKIEWLKSSQEAAGVFASSITPKTNEDRLKHLLVEVGRTNDGSSVLYLDRSEGGYWELTYPDNSRCGREIGLIQLPCTKASGKYKIFPN